MSRGCLAKPPQVWVMDVGVVEVVFHQLSAARSVWAAAAAGCEAERSGWGEAEGDRVPWDPR